MFENFGTALIQLVGFFGVFGFFVYQLLSDKRSGKSNKSNIKPKDTIQKKERKSGFFSRRKNEIEEEAPKNKKNRWFK